MKRLQSLTLFLLSLPALGQEPVGVSALPAVEKNGFYRIHLSPNVVSYLTPGFANVRIIGDDGVEVPYLLDEERPSFSTTSFRQYKMEPAIKPGCCTELIFHNPDRSNITNISLQIRNADVYKTANLLGSDDQKQWFALREDFSIYPINSREETTEIRIMDFPLSNYGYYKLVIDDSTSAPLNFLKAGYYESSTEAGRYTEIQKLTFKAEDRKAEKQTWVNIALDTTALFDKLMLDISGPSFYHRQASIYARRWYPDKKGKMVESLEYVADLSLISRQQASLRLSSVRAMELVIRIDNDDNPPLTINAVKLLQLNRYLVAWLSPGKTYRIEVGSEDQSAPVYDLAFFRDSIPANPPSLSTTELVVRAVPVRESFTLFTNRNVIWVAIILVVAILGYMSRKLIKEAAARQD